MSKNSAEKRGVGTDDTGGGAIEPGGDANVQANDGNTKLSFHKLLSRFRIRRAGRLPGQGGVNPCFCFSWCCRGTCTLFTGCIVIGSYEIIIGVIKILYKISAYAIFIDTQPRIIRYRWDSFKLIDFLLHLPPAILHVVKGIILLAAALKLSGILCNIYIVLSFVEMVIQFFMSGILTYSLPDREPTDPEAEAYYYTGLWSGSVLNLFIAIYTILCAYCLKLQIQDKEYDLPPPVSSTIVNSPPTYEQFLAKDNPFSSPFEGGAALIVGHPQENLTKSQ